MPLTARNNHGNDKTTIKATARKKKSPMSRLMLLRLVFIFALAIAAAVCGYVSFAVISNLEDDVAVQTYQSVADSALQGAQAITARKVQGGRVMASILQYAFSSAEQWPFIYLQGYSETAQEIAQLASSTSLALIVLVDPDEATQFQDFALETYQQNNFSETAGWSDFGFGIYRQDFQIPGQDIFCNFTDGRCPDTSGVNPWGGRNRMLTPIYLHNIKNAKSLMFNVYSEQFRTNVLDSMVGCASLARDLQTKPQCDVVTNWVKIIVRPGPASVLYQPIFPAQDPNTMVAFTGTSIHWEEVLKNIVPNYVDGLHCVIWANSGSDSDSGFTFVIHKGQPVLVGPGDWHDRDFEQYGHSVVLNELTTNATASVVYTLTVYPTALMFEQFTSNSPVAVSLAFVAVILLCTMIFFVYDFFVRNEAQQRQAILEMKRRFVRFISHEIRTPLNIMCMGLDLLQRELQNKMEQDQLQFQQDQQQEKAAGATGCKTNSVDSHGPNEAYWLDLTGDILENTHNSVSILNDLLNYDKIETGSFHIEFATVEIWQLIRKTLSEFKIQAKNRKICLDLTMQGMPHADPEGLVDDEEVGEDADVEDSQLSNLNVLGDDIRLTQVLRNLLSNALKFTPEEGRVDVNVVYIPHGLPNAKLAIQDTAYKAAAADNDALTTAIQAPRAGSIAIAIKDNGVGLTYEQLALLFTEGTQFDKNKLQAGGGSGLGLCISREIVQQHGGTIEAHSEGRGMGTSFLVELPLYRDLVLSDKLQRQDALEHLPGCSDTETSFCMPHHQNILVVDDVLSNSKMLIRLLERAGHTCERAMNGQEAVDAYVANRAQTDATPFHTILMDFEMPVMNGPDATKVLRDLGCFSYIVGITGNVLAEDVRTFKNAGADHVLPKPVNLATIEACWASVGSPPVPVEVTHKPATDETE